MNATRKNVVMRWAVVLLGIYFLTLPGILAEELIGQHEDMPSLSEQREYSPAISSVMSEGSTTDICIDFDHLPDGRPTPLEGVIGDDYAEWGVHFRSIGVSDMPVYWNVLREDNTYAIARHCSGYPPGFNIVADFDRPVDRISVKVAAAKDVTITMIAKNAYGSVIGSVVSPPMPASYTFVGPIELTTASPITSVEWWPSNQYSGVSLDDLCIPGGPDLNIDRIRPVQVVWDSDIDGDDVNDLVLGKKAAIEVKVNVQGEFDEEDVEIRLLFGSSELSGSFRIEDLRDRPAIFYYTPSTAADQEISVQIDPDDIIEEANEENNEKSIDVTVKDTKGLHIIYFPVDGKDRGDGLPYGPINMTEYAETVEKNGQFIGGVYPVAELELINDKRNTKYYGSSPMGVFGWVSDLLTLWMWGQLSSVTACDRVIGIVPDDYLQAHDLGTNYGICVPWIPVGIVEQGCWTVGAHELGHTYGLDDQYTLTSSYTGAPASGFWVNMQQQISNGICFMGTAQKHTFWYSSTRPYWICTECYKCLFKHPEFRTDPTDPAVLLISGTIAKDGTVQFSRLYTCENGQVGYGMPGEYAVEIVDIDEHVLAEVSFHTAFNACVEPGGIIDMDFAAFAVVVPYPHGAVTVRLKQNGEVLATINPNSNLLRDALESVPDQGFRNRANQQRTILYSKINEIEIKLEAGDIKGAYDKLTQDLRDKLEKWLADYSTENPGQLTKTEILTLVDEIADRLRSIGDLVEEADSATTPPPTIGELVSSHLEAPVTEQTPPAYEPREDDMDVPAAFDPRRSISFFLFEADAIIRELNPTNFSSEESAIELTTTIDAMFAMLDDGLYPEALDVLTYDILQRTDGCANIGQPDEDDWITSIEGQALLYPLIMETIELLERLL